MLLEATVTVQCDCCGGTEDVEFTTMAGRLDRHDVTKALEAAGWLPQPREEYLCPDCATEDLDDDD